MDVSMANVKIGVPLSWTSWARTISERLTLGGMPGWAPSAMASTLDSFEAFSGPPAHSTPRIRYVAPWICERTKGETS